VERDGDSQPLQLPDMGMTPEAYAVNGDLGSLLAAALSRLSAEHREVILLDQAGLDYAEMAATLGVEIGTVKSRLSRARERMRRLLTGLDDWSAEPKPEPRRHLGVKGESMPGGEGTEP
jgi:RNA polymerase sigma-70 factor (ECF subfamily)